MPVDFDTNPNRSSLEVGIELEYPRLGDNAEKYVDRGRNSNQLRREVAHVGRGDAAPTYDGTVGLEVVSDVLSLSDLEGWYLDVLDYLREEHNERYQPTGLMDGGSTAGLHIHVSRLSESQARELYEMSQEPWLQVLFCTSIAVDDGQPTWPVFRGGSYCRLNYDSRRYDVVNSRGGGHYEWRLPEPMNREHIEILQEFLRAFEQSPEAAREYGQEILDEGDDRITSIRRAEAVGMDINDIPVVLREAHPDDPENFFEEVRSEWHLPEIHQVEYNGNNYYVFETDLRGTWEVSGVTFAHDSVLIADELEQVSNETVAEDVIRAFDARNRSDGPTRETEATHELKKIVKKKKE